MNKKGFTPVKCNQGLLFSKAKNFTGFTPVKYFQRKFSIKDRNFTGFTLIELLIVIGIIAILASAVIVAINPGQQFAAARDATRERHINSLYNSLISYQVANQGSWGDLSAEIDDTLTEICNTNLDNPDCTDLADLSDLVASGYINQIPVDPQVEGDGTGYYIAKGSVILIAGNRETRFIGVGAKEDEIEFENGVPSIPFSCGDTFTDDRDEEAYATVEIGDQCWFAEDLRYDCTDAGYNNIGESEDWDDSGNCAEVSGYDNLHYQWDVAMDGSTTEGAQGLCPDGWHVPTDDEWTTLEDWLTNNGYEDEEGDALKDPNEDWCDGDDPCGGTDFLALPGGYRDTFGNLYNVGSFGNWWSCTEDDSNAWYRSLYSSFSDVRRRSNSQAYGYSVRCLRDEN